MDNSKKYKFFLLVSLNQIKFAALNKQNEIGDYMNNIELSFKEKLKLYYDLAQYFEFELQNNKSNKKLENLILRLKKWGKELKIRKNYYEV